MAVWLIAGWLSASLAPQVQEPIEVIDVVGERNQGVSLPHEQEVEGLFGRSDTLLDIDRGVTVIDASLMRAANVSNIHDIKKFSPNTQAAAGFGNPSLPSIRGQLGELFEGGMRRQAGNNGLGIPLSLNAIESITVVRGAPPVLLGTTQRVGGFVNLTPKRARTDHDVTSINLHWAEWQRQRIQLDHNELLNTNRQALRVSLEYVDENSFYDYTKLRSNDVLVAYRHQLDAENYWDIAVEYYDAAWTDNAGINRPTQALIDANQYITGIGVQPNGSQVPGAGAVISPTGVVTIPRSQVLTDPLDHNSATTLLLHSAWYHSLNADWNIVNRTYYQHLTREGINQNSFVEIIDGAHTFENRLELHWQDDTIVGTSLRVNDVLGYSQFTTEADLPIDLTAGLTARRIPLTPEQQARLIELREGLFVSPGGQYDINGDGLGDFNLSDTTNSHSQQWALFAQHRLSFTKSWSATLGLRADYYDVNASDPIAPAGVVAARDSINKWLTATHISTAYRLAEELNLYGTAYWSDSTSNSMAGGTVLNAQGEIDSQNFATENTLYEIGLKYQPVHQRWYTDMAWFQQTRSLRNRDGSNSGIVTEGFESQWNYRHEAGYWLTLAATYMDARYDNSAVFQDSRMVADAFDNSRPDLINGTGIGAPNFTVFAPSQQRVQGVSPVQVGLAWGWSFAPDWEVGGDAEYTKSYPLDYLQTVMIRDQHHVNMHLSWQVNKQINARLDVINLTGQDNWAPVFEGGYFGSTLAFPSLPRYLQISVNMRF